MRCRHFFLRRASRFLAVFSLSQYSSVWPFFEHLAHENLPLCQKLTVSPSTSISVGKFSASSRVLKFTYAVKPPVPTGADSVPCTRFWSTTSLTSTMVFSWLVILAIAISFGGLRHTIWYLRKLISPCDTRGPHVRGIGCSVPIVSASQPLLTRLIAFL